MLTLKGLLVSVCFTFLLFFGIPSKVKEETWQEDEFEFFIKKFNKSYANETVSQQRYVAFKKSLELIENLNGNRTSKIAALYGITAYSDMYTDEFIDNHLQKDYSKRIQLRRTRNNDESDNGSKEIKKSKRKSRAALSIPRKVDWRSKGVVTDVNNQYSCGACWAFSTIETVESMHAIKTGKLLKLSTQQMIDCAGYRNNGCKGGDICSLLEWLSDNNVKIRTNDEYPLQLKNEQCKMNSSQDEKGIDGVQVTKYACETLIDDEDYLLAAVARQGPVAVAVNAITWQNYLGGVIQYHCSPHFLLMNHAVQIVGYDLDAEIPHYIVRNSWGSEFGDKGYLYIAVGDNLCGIANEVSAIKVT